jgi:hypothetical protein
MSIYFLIRLLAVCVHTFFYFIFLAEDTGDWSQGLVHAWQELSHGATFQTLYIFFKVVKDMVLKWLKPCNLTTRNC